MKVCIKQCIAHSNSQSHIQLQPNDTVRVIKKLRNVIQLELNQKQIVYLNAAVLQSNFKQI